MATRDARIIRCRIVDNRPGRKSIANLAQDCHQFVKVFGHLPKGLEVTKFKFNLIKMKLLLPKNIKFMEYYKLLYV